MRFSIPHILFVTRRPSRSRVEVWCKKCGWKGQHHLSHGDDERHALRVLESQHRPAIVIDRRYSGGIGI